MDNKHLAEEWAKRLLEDSIRDGTPLATLDPAKYFLGCLNDACEEKDREIAKLGAVLKHNIIRAEEVHDLDMTEIGRLKKRIEGLETVVKFYYGRAIPNEYTSSKEWRINRQLVEHLDILHLDSTPPTENRPAESHEDSQQGDPK